MLNSLLMSVGSVLIIVLWFIVVLIVSVSYMSGVMCVLSS